MDLSYTFSYCFENKDKENLPSHYNTNDKKLQSIPLYYDKIKKTLYYGFRQLDLGYKLSELKALLVSDNYKSYGVGFAFISDYKLLLLDVDAKQDIPISRIYKLIEHLKLDKYLLFKSKNKGYHILTNYSLSLEEEIKRINEILDRKEDDIKEIEMMSKLCKKGITHLTNKLLKKGV